MVAAGFDSPPAGKEQKLNNNDKRRIKQQSVLCNESIRKENE